MPLVVFPRFTFKETPSEVVRIEGYVPKASDSLLNVVSFMVSFKEIPKKSFKYRTRAIASVSSAPVLLQNDSNEPGNKGKPELLKKATSSFKRDETKKGDQWSFRKREMSTMGNGAQGVFQFLEKTQKLERVQRIMFMLEFPFPGVISFSFT